jgi:hypothetical protein
MKVRASVIIIVLIVAIVELAGLYYFIANYPAESSPAQSTGQVNYTRDEMISLALQNGTVEEYTSHLEYNITDVNPGIDYMSIEFGNNTTYWVGLSIGFDPSQKAVDYVHLEGLSSYGFLDAGAVKTALMNKTVQEYVANQTYIVSEVNGSQQYVLLDIGDMIWSCRQIQVNEDFKNDTVTCVNDLGTITLLQSQNTSVNIADNN